MNGKSTFSIKFLIKSMPYKWAIFLITACAEGLRLCVPLLTGLLVDSFANPGKLLPLPIHIAAFLLSAECLSVCFAYIKNITELKSFAALHRTVFSEYWRKVIALKVGKFLEQPAGAWMERLSNDVSVVLMAVKMAVGSILSFVLFFFGSCILIFKRHWLFIPLFILAILIGTLIYSMHRKKIFKTSERTRKTYYAFNSLLYGLVQMHPILSVHKQTGAYLPVMGRQIYKTTERDRQMRNLFNRHGFSLDFSFWAVNACIMLFCVSKISQGAMSIGEMVTFTACAGQLLGGVQNVISVMPDISEGMESLKAIQNSVLQPEMQTERELPADFKKDNLDIAAKCENISFSYGDKEIISDFSAVFRKNELGVFVGKNGSGKSTLAKLILGIYSPCKGNAESSRRIGWIPQDGEILDGSILENVRLRDYSISEDSVRNAINMCGLEKWADSMPKGIYSNISPRSISGGQKQLISIARAIVRSPDLLVIDEISNNLDILMKKKIYDVVKNCALNRCIILISHDIESVNLANRLFFFGKDGIKELPKGTSENKVLELLGKES